MALKLLQPGLFPLGQFDVLDGTTVLGGEVVGLKSILNTVATDLAAADSYDGYVHTEKRSVVTKALTNNPTDGYTRPLMLADDGVAGYGTLLGSVVGGTVGNIVTGGAVVGPHTATGSGKLTLWANPGLYAVSLDACDTAAATGLTPTNTTLNSGDPLYATAAGLLTPREADAFAAESTVVARFVEFQTNGSLVNTPNRLVAALNSPTGSGTPTRTFSFAAFYFCPPIA